MNSGVLSANQLIRESQASAHRYNLFKALLGGSDAVPLDGSGTFSLVKSDRYKEMLASMEEGHKLKEQIEQKCYLLNLENIELSKEVQLLRNEIGKFKENEVKFEAHISGVTQQLKKNQRRIVQLQTALRETLIRKNQEELLAKPSQANMPAMTVSAGVQTLWEESVAEVVGDVMKDINMENASYSAEEKLYGLLRQNAEKFEAEFREKMKKLQEAQVLVDRWEAEKEQYRLENEQLKSKLQARNLEDEKLRLWKEGISEMVERVEKTINQPEAGHLEPQPAQNDPDSDWKKDALRQARLVELRLRMREAEGEMRVEEEDQEEGPVNKLVRLSQKVRTLVQGMLIQTNCSK